MSLETFWALGQYIFVVLPMIVLMLSARWLFTGGGEQQGSNKLFLPWGVGLLALALFDISIWFNPYGRELSSSLPGWGMLPVVIVLWAIILRRVGDLIQLGKTQPLAMTALALVAIILFSWLWLAEAITFYLIVGVTVVLAGTWVLASRSGLALLTVLSLIILGYLFITIGGAFFILGPQDPGWLRSGLGIATGVLSMFTIFLAAAVLYTGLNGDTPLKARLSWSLVLVMGLVTGCAYFVFWEGIWSSAHGRAFEDHLPFAQFILSLVAGGLLVASLRGWKWLAGPGLVILITTLTTLALILGWNISAFQLTERRAERVNQTVLRYYQDTGRYPSQLGELTSRYLLYVPPPVVVRQGGWCYQGGPTGYRLGYVSGNFTYWTQNYEAVTYAQAGEPSKGAWICDQLVAEFESGKINY